MPKKQRRVHFTNELPQSAPIDVIDEYVDEAMQIKIEPVDVGYENGMMQCNPAKTVIYNENDENKAAVEAESGLISQLDFIKTEVDIDDATIKEFREEMRRMSHDLPNANSKQKSPTKRRKREVVPKKTTAKRSRVEEKKTEKSKKPVAAKKKRMKRKKGTDTTDKKGEIEPLNIVVNGVKMAKCHFCDFKLTSRNRSLVKEHIRLHTGFCPFACMHCPQKFTIRNTLVSHIHRDHPEKPKYKCLLCRVWFFTKKDFDTHEFKCVKKRSFECHLCKYTMKHVQMHRINEHMRKEHTGERVFQCEYCDELFLTKKSLKCHQVHHPGAVPFKCHNCKGRFMTEERFKIHEIYCSTRDRYECHLCKYTRVQLSFEGLRLHMRKHTGEKPHQCQYCKKFFPRIEALSHHIQRHRELFNFKCVQCHRRFIGADELKRHEEKCRKRRYECHLCSFTKFGLSFNKFRRHFALKHVGERYAKCMGCTGTFSSTVRLARHITENHPKLLALICPNCSGRFTSKEARNQHERFCMKRRIECYICGLTLRNVKSLRGHMVSKHTGEAKFQCSQCPKKFLIEANLKIHSNAHSTTGLMKCDYCNKKFIHIKYKKKHEFRCKQVFQCWLCKETFPTFAVLQKTHMRTHLGKRPYSCTHCSKTSVSIRMYTIHVLDIHLKQYKFKCNTCNGTLEKKQDIVKHQRSCMKGIRQSVGIIYFKCSLCGLGLPRVPELKQHILNAECANHPKKSRKK